ncbi:molybdopterin-dependent oxidoreductase, partial [Accumulibacter sp.]|uniref:molybdopterin-dependent oxidoreductase n=1 Tax=Accumulibacter sp. TaxID=2053492 RepID=UPI001AC96863
MSQNLIALNLTPDDIAAIDAALATLESRLAGLVELSPEERRSLAKMGDKSEAFCRQTLIVLDQNRQIVPAGLDLAGAESDLQQLDLLRPRLARLRRLKTRAEDTEMALGSDVLSAALEGYALAKVFGKGAGLDALKDVVKQHGAGDVGFLGSPHATLEELVLLKKLAGGLGSKNIDFRLRRRDFSADGKLAGRPWLGLKLAEIKDLDAALVIGSFLRKEQPLIAQRLRQAAKKYTKVSFVSVGGDDQLIKLHQSFNVSPAHLTFVVAAIAKAAAYAKGVPAVSGFDGIEPCEKAKAIAQSLLEGEKRHIFLGNVAEQHPEAATIH